MTQSTEKTKGASTEKILKDALASFFKQFKSPKAAAAKAENVPGVEFEQGTASTAKGVAPKSRSSKILRGARFALLMVIGGIVLSNARPYIDICAMLGTSFGSLGIMPFLLKVPLLGWLLSTGGALLAFVAGILLWFVLQTLQMLPVLLQDSPAMMIALIAWAGQFKAVKITNNDSEAMIALKQSFNALPTKWLNDANSARAIGYLVDLLLVGRFYPPIVGGYDRLGVFWAAPMASDIDVQNIAVGLFAMFGVEVAYKVWKLFNGFIELSKGVQTQ
jgi:hypothetical protein